MRTRALRYSGVGLALLLQCLTLPSRALACVVGTGRGASCTESALNACLPGGRSFDGAVTFNCGGAATITVTSTKTISAATTIDGGSLITISGGNSVRVFLVNTGVKSTVQNLTVANGNNFYGNGGGIASGGTLTVTNSTFSGNSTGYGGGGIYSIGTLTVTNTTFSGNSAYGSYGSGGGIYSNSTLTVTNSTFSGNSAVYGGGILSGGTLTVTKVTDSTFSGNSAEGLGGGISNAEGGTLTVTNSTFSGNNAVFGGGIENDGTLTVTNTIVAHSTSGGNCDGSVTDGGHNIDDGTTCGFSGATGSLSNTNPMFDPAGLANNGGPTQTIALRAGSPAVNAGNESVCAAPPVNNRDQRGYVRPGTGATNCSIGAFEANVTQTSCVGDCDGKGQVTVDEILTMVNIALGNANLSTCDAGDANHDGHITVDEILTAVNNALNGCGFIPTPTKTSTPTATWTPTTTQTPASACTAALSSPANGASISFPQTFSWSTAGSCTNPSLAFAASAHPSTVATFSVSGSSTTINSTQWSQTQAIIGTGSTYYWAVGESIGEAFYARTSYNSFTKM